MGLRLDGVDQYLEALSSPVTVHPITAFLRVYLPNASSDLGFPFYVGDAAANWRRFHFNPFSGTMYLNVQGVTANTSATLAYTAGWKNMSAIMRSPTDRTLRIDGVTADNTDNSGEFSGIDTILVGARYSTVPAIEGYFDGDIETTALWDTDLSDDELSALEAGWSPSLVRPGNLKFYREFIRNMNWPYKGPLLTSYNSPSVVAHSRNIIQSVGSFATWAPAPSGGGPDPSTGDAVPIPKLRRIGRR